MRTLLFILIAVFVQLSLQAQSRLQLDTIRYSGDPDKFINFVILGDGYTAGEQQKLRNDADSVTRAFFRFEPWASYASYFNVFLVHTVSAQSGIAHPNTAADCAGTGVPVSAPNTYFGATFDFAGIHRLVTVPDPSKVVSTLIANFPNFDQAIVLANTPYYGGSGGGISVITMNENSIEVAAHEIGHSFANLADEYYAGDIYAGERANMTQQTNPALVKWKAWMGTGGTGIYQHCCGGAAASWYRPNTDCKMGVLNAAYCPVCTEAIIETIHAAVNPIVSYTPPAGSVAPSAMDYRFRLTTLMKPVPNTLKITWKLDGSELPAFSGQDTAVLSAAAFSAPDHRLRVTVVDTTSQQRVSNHDAIHVSTVSWASPGSTGVRQVAREQRYRLELFPNPAQDALQVNIELAKADILRYTVTDLGGRLLISGKAAPAAPGPSRKVVDISALPAGTYLLQATVGDDTQTLKFVKL